MTKKTEKKKLVRMAGFIHSPSEIITEIRKIMGEYVENTPPNIYLDAVVEYLDWFVAEYVR